MEVTRTYAADWPHVDKSEARKWLKCSIAWPKVNQIWWVPWWMYSTSYRLIPWVCMVICGHHENVTGGQTDGSVSEGMDGQAHSYANGVYDIKYICHHWVRLWFVIQTLSKYCSEKCWSLRWADLVTACVKLLTGMSLTMWSEQRGVIFPTSSNAFWFQISMNYDPYRLTNNKSALVQVIACCLLGVKPLSKLVIIDFTAACSATKPLRVKCCHKLQFLLRHGNHTRLLVHDLHSPALINWFMGFLFAIIGSYLFINTLCCIALMCNKIWEKA